MPTIEIKKLFKKYKNGDTEVVVLNQVDLKIEQGETIALTGPSGAGKTTLMHLLGCLDIPTSGQYILEGQEISTLTKKQLARIRNQKIGFVFQNFHLLPDLNALENVILPQIYGGIPQLQARQKGQQLLELVGLSSRLSHYPHQLSGGQKQRVAIARALVMDPKILLADEPTGNLDSENTQQILDLFTKINASQQTTLVIVTHSTEVTCYMRRCIQLRDGQIISDQYNQSHGIYKHL